MRRYNDEWQGGQDLSLNVYPPRDDGRARSFGKGKPTVDRWPLTKPRGAGGYWMSRPGPRGAREMGTAFPRGSGDVIEIRQILAEVSP